MKKTEGGVTAPRGFLAAGAAAGIKKNQKDMAMIYSRKPCRAAGTFTKNLVKAAPVKWDQEVVYEGGTVQAVVVNSGVANACTGKEGYDCLPGNGQEGSFGAESHLRSGAGGLHRRHRRADSRREDKKRD